MCCEQPVISVGFESGIDNYYYCGRAGRPGCCPGRSMNLSPVCVTSVSDAEFIMNRSVPVSLISLLGVFLIGCSKVDSEDIKTSGIYTEAGATAEDDNTLVFVRMRTGRPLDADTIILSPGDQLSASMSGNTIGLFRTDSDAYQGTFTDATGGSEVKITLSRQDDPDASDSVVTLPNQFTISAPDAGEIFNSGENITVVWSPAEPLNMVKVTYHIDCRIYDDRGLPSGANFGRGYTVVDSGTHTALINDVLNAFGNQDELIEGEPCRFEVSVTRTNEGTLDPALTKGGYIRARREKNVLVTVVP